MLTQQWLQQRSENKMGMTFTGAGEDIKNLLGEPSSSRSRSTTCKTPPWRVREARGGRSRNTVTHFRGLGRLRKNSLPSRLCS